MPDQNDALRLLRELDAETVDARNALKVRLTNVQTTALEGQIAFLKDLVNRPEESRKFLTDPKQYSVDHGILLHPDVVELVTSLALYGGTLDEEFCGVVGPHVVKDLVDIRARLRPPKTGPSVTAPGGSPIVMNAAAVAAGAAVAMAAAAVAEAVVTVVRTTRPSDLALLQGLGANGTVLPSGLTFRDRTGLRATDKIPGLRGGSLSRFR